MQRIRYNFPDFHPWQSGSRGRLLLLVAEQEHYMDRQRHTDRNLYIFLGLSLQLQ